MDDRRRGRRVTARFELLYASGRQEGTGALGDISYSGASVEETALRPEIGSTVRLYVFVNVVSPVEIVGQVARHTDHGFAIQYKIDDPEVMRLVDDVASIIVADRR